MPSLPVRLPPRPVFLAGREDLLADLDTRLAGGAGQQPGARIVALCGLGGAGKTSMAVEYAHRHLAEVEVCWLLPAEDPEILAAEFGVLAAQLGAREIADVRDPIASVHAVLARASAGWLLIFDNAPDWLSIERFLPPAGDGRVLITTQSQHWPPGQGLQVPVLDPVAAADFLVSRTGDANQAAARELADELGGLPLALEQAAAYMQATGTPSASYLPLFRARQADLLARGEAAGHREHTAATLGLALSRLEDDSPAAAGLLRLLAFLAPEPVPLDLLLLPGTGAEQQLGEEAAPAVGMLWGDPVTVRDAVAALRRYSLVTLAGPGLVQVHRLVQAVTRSQLTAEQTRHWLRTAAAAVDAAIPANAGLPSAWSACELLLPHAWAVLGPTSSGFWQIVDYVGRSGNYVTARDMTALIVDVFQMSKDFGSDHAGTLAARATLAYWTGEAGDAAAARDLYAGLLPIRERVSGPEHPETLTIRGNLARWTGSAGDPAAARDQYAALLPDAERILGPEHPSTLNHRANLAEFTGQAGDPAAARDRYAGLLPIRERVSGPEHPATLANRSNLAGWTGEAGDPEAARDQYAALLPIHEKVSGPGHPETLTIRGNLARWTGSAGDPAAARDQYTALLPDAERILGPEHPSTLTDRANLASYTGKAGNPAAARDQYAALLPVRERVLGPRHPDTLNIRGNLARWTGEAGDAAAARDQYAVLLPVREQVSGPEHPDTMNTRGDLAQWCGEAGDAAAARDQYAALLRARRRILGPKHPDTLSTRANLARWTGQAGNAAAARDRYAALLRVRERIFGPEHPRTLTTRANCASWTGEAGNPEAARDQYAALLPIRERVSGPEHPDTLITRANLIYWTKRAKSDVIKRWLDTYK